MSTVWVVSAVLGWAVIALLVAVVLSLLRQTAELRMRLDAFDGGTLLEDDPDDADEPLHRDVPAVEVPVLAGPGGSGQQGAVGAPGPAGRGAVGLGGRRDRGTLLVYHSPGCHGCAGLEDAVHDLAGETPGVDVVSVLALREDVAAAHARGRRDHAAPTVSVDVLPPVLRRPWTPTMVGVGADGTVTLVGRPNGLADLRAAARAVAAG